MSNFIFFIICSKFTEEPKRIRFCLYNLSSEVYWCIISFFRFQTQYGVRAQTALPYAMNSEFSRVIASQMVAFFQNSNL